MSNSVAGRRERTAATQQSWRQDGCKRGEDGPGLYGRDGARKYLNREERDRALKAMAALEAHAALFALTLAWTGARVSEVLALTPSSFQIEAGIVALATLKRRRHVMREVPIPPELMGVLDRHFGLSKLQKEQEDTAHRLWPWHRVTAWRIIKQVMVRAGIKGRQSSPRGLRHAFGIGTLQAGVPLTLAQRWLGHARLSTTAIYADVCGPDEIVFAERFWASAPRRAL
jgi:integrase/recombinase XerD